MNFESVLEISPRILRNGFSLVKRIRHIQNQQEAACLASARVSGASNISALLIIDNGPLCLKKTCCQHLNKVALMTFNLKKLKINNATVQMER